MQPAPDPSVPWIILAGATGDLGGRMAGSLLERVAVSFLSAAPPKLSSVTTASRCWDRARTTNPIPVA